MAQTTDLPKPQTATCNKCDKPITGLPHDGYLWPLWMAKPDAQEFPPHGPRIFNFELGECWHCSLAAGDDWHRR